MTSRKLLIVKVVISRSFSRSYYFDLRIVFAISKAQLLYVEALPLHAEALLLQLKALLLALKALLLPFRDKIGTFYFLVFTFTKYYKFFVTNLPKSLSSRMNTGLSIGRQEPETSLTPPLDLPNFDKNNKDKKETVKFLL